MGLRKNRKLSEVDLGRWEFAPHRRDLRDDERLEPNTEEEKIIFATIRGWIDSVIPPSKDEIELIKAAMSDPRYSDFFHGPPESAIVYRGISGVIEEKLKKWLGVSLDEKIPSIGSADGNWLMRSRSGQNFVSYTKDVNIAYSFSFVDSEKRSDDLYRVIFAAKVSDNPGTFLDLHSICKRLESGTFSIDIHREKEVAATRPVNVYKIWWTASDRMDPNWGPASFDE